MQAMRTTLKTDECIEFVACFHILLDLEMLVNCGNHVKVMHHMNKVTYLSMQMLTSLV